MKKIILSGLAILLVLSFTACGSKSTTASNTNSNDTTSDSSKKNARISFDFADKSTKTYKEHVQELWNKTKAIWNEDATKNYSDEEYMALGKEIDVAWVNLQAHTSIASNGHDEAAQDTSDLILGNMTGNIIGDTDKIYGQRSQSSTKEEREARRKTGIKYLSTTIKEYDDKLASLKIN